MVMKNGAPIGWMVLLIACLAAEGSQSVPSVGLWDRFETSVANSKSYADPYNDVTLNVTYTRPGGSTVSFWGFHDGGTTWKLRFMPDQTGTWQYSASFSDGSPGASGTFTCVSSSIPGMISRDASNPMWFGYKGGGHVLVRSFHVGDRFFAKNWDDPANTGDGNKRKAFLDWAQQQGYNAFSIASHYLNRNVSGRGAGWDTPDLWNSSTQRPNAAEYREMEVILDDLASRKILVFPFAGFFGKASDFPADATRQNQYVKYTLARLGPYWNVLLNVGGPEPLLDNYLTSSDIARLGGEIKNRDVFAHPLSCHNKTGDDAFKDSSWSSYGTLQGPKTTSRSTLSAGLLKNHHASKPLYAQETLWPGNQNHPAYTDTDLRKNAYVIHMSATALNYADMDGDSSSGFSGSMDLAAKIQSRHDIAKKVWDFFASIPFYSMSPRQDLVSAGYALAKPGGRYLVYLESRGTVNVTVTGGPYAVEWINAQNTVDRRPGGTTSNGQGLASPSDGDDWLLSLTPGGTSTPPAVTGFALINADTDQEIGPLADGASINLAALPTRNLNVRADTSPATVGSVKFGYDANPSYRIENGAPYALAGGSGNDYSAWTPTVGSHTVTATPYTASGATGTAGTAKSVFFTVTDQAAGDATKPSVAITQPTSSSSYAAPSFSLALSGTASDNVGVTAVTYSLSGATAASGTAGGTTAWSIPPLTVNAGTTTVTVTARDAAGNTASDALTVTYAAPARTAKYVLDVSGANILLNGQAVKVIGLRCSNALISDAKTDMLVNNLDAFKSYGVNTVSVFFMGSRFGDVKGYNPDATLNPACAGRMARVIEAADSRGMVVLVGCLYWSTSAANDDLGKWTQAEANRAVANTVRWLKDHSYKNVFVDVDNEGMAHDATGWSIAQMIDAGHAVNPDCLIAYNDSDPAPANADLCIHHSPKVAGKPWLESEGTPTNAPGGYWGSYSKLDGYYNYIRIGRYTADMKTNQISQTNSHVDTNNGHMLASTWLQCAPSEGIGGPFMKPGGLADNPNIDADVKVVQPEAGILWWLNHVKSRYGAWVPPGSGSGSNQPPSATFAAPKNGDAFDAGVNLVVNVTASDPDGAVSNVKLYLNGALVRQENTAPYEWGAAGQNDPLLQNMAAGTYTLNAVATDNAGATGSATIAVTVRAAASLPAPWQGKDVGSVGAAGSAAYSNGTFTAEGSGADIWGAADAFRFVYQTLTGDGEIVARVASIENTHAWAKAGVMFRETLEAGSKHAMMAITPGNGASFQRRVSTGGTSQSTSVAGITAPYWVKVVRQGDNFSGYRSADGVTWTWVATATIPMASTVTVGLAVTSHDNAVLCTASFDGVKVTPTVPPPAELVKVVSVSTNRPYSLAEAKVGALPYIDRSYAITSLGAGLAGGVLVRTAMDDKYVTAASHLTLSLGGEADVYVGYDKRGTLPGWLAGWTLTSETLVSTDGAASPMRVYLKTVGAGTLTLGGNLASPASGAQANYAVVVQPAGASKALTTATGALYVEGPIPADQWLNDGDGDGDGLLDDFELIYALDPASSDTDGDGVPDESEVLPDGRTLWEVQMAGGGTSGADDGGGGDGCGATGVEGLLVLGALLVVRRLR